MGKPEMIRWFWAYIGAPGAVRGIGRIYPIALGAVLLTIGPAGFGATNYYVATNGSDAVAVAGTNWDTALLTISNALAKTGPSGDKIIVSNGTYSLTATNLIITNGVELRSLSGATNTLIRRSSALNFRIMYISNVNAVVDGFTITNGNWNGVYIDTAGTVSNCIISDNLTVNLSISGGGVYLKNGGLVKNCRIIRNYVRTSGGGGGSGGGAYLTGGMLENCVIADNAVGTGTGNGSGGGVYMTGNSRLRNCLIYNNNHNRDASGVYCSGGTVENCTIVSNYCPWVAGVGGVRNAGAAILNSIIYFNTTHAAGAQNYTNTGSAWSYTNCCTTPAVAGSSNITAAPEFADIGATNLHLLPGSPCIDTGTNQTWMETAYDLDGNARILNTLVDRGAYEYKSGALACNPIGAPPLTGFLSNSVVFTAGVAGTNTTGLYYRWDFTNNGSAFGLEGADKQTVTNVYLPGLYSVRLVVTNAIGEIAAIVKTNYIQVGPAIAYVATNTMTPVYPYTNWAGAATNIQSAIDAGVDGTKVLVTDGVYLVTSQVDLQKGMSVQSVNGASNTLVRRVSGNCRVFHLSHSNAVVDGFTITNGNLSGVHIDAAGTVSNCIISDNITVNLTVPGGGVYLNYGGLVKNCRIIRNRVSTSGGASMDGGGAYLTGGMLENCVIADNTVGTGTAAGYGGGVYLTGSSRLRNCLIYNNTHNRNVGGVYCGAGSTVESCTIVSNYTPLATGVGGVWNAGGAVLNSIIYFNQSGHDVTWWNYSNAGAAWSYTNCCTTPAVTGSNNITADPKFADTNAANYRLVLGSPCLKAGTNQVWMIGATDLEGKPRIYGARVDLGAYSTYVPPKGTIMFTW